MYGGVVVWVAREEVGGCAADYSAANYYYLARGRGGDGHLEGVKRGVFVEVRLVVFKAE